MSRTLARVFAALLVAGVAFRASGRADGPVRVRLATTTSVEDSGLLEALLPAFERSVPGIRIEALAVGTGKALKLAERGDVDLVLVHAPDLEEDFLAKGLGADAAWIMKNDFVIVGPGNDPARVRDAGTLGEALSRLSQSGAFFISRGDESGTHQKEKALWKEAGGVPGSYLESGQGMCATLRIAGEKGAYTLSDRSSFLACGKDLGMQILFQGDPSLENLYRVILVNPKRHPHVRYDEAKRFLNWLVSEEGQQQIGSYERDGIVLFHPFSRSIQQAPPAGPTR